MKALYPASNKLDDLNHSQCALKIARHSPCSLCNNACLGLQPPLGIKAVLDESSFQGLFGLDGYGSDDDDESNGQLSYLEFCQCGHDVKYHGANEAEIGSGEFTRRARVAIRLDELIQVCITDAHLCLSVTDPSRAKLLHAQVCLSKVSSSC
jgi:hypothetical protein